MTTAVDRIQVNNVGNRAMDSVKIMLSDELAGIFFLDQDRFRSIQPNEEVNVEIRYNSGDLKTFMLNFKGEIRIVSEHHKVDNIPVSIEWKEISNEHFIINARSGDEVIAEKVLETLENNYQALTAGFDEKNSKTVIYMTNNIEEMKLINPSGHSYYSRTHDTIVICACDYPEYNALKQFLYRLVVNNCTSYYNVEKFISDQENWLLDGVTSYFATNITGITGKYKDAFSNNSVAFQWYGYGSDAKYGATHSFFEYLESEYGPEVLFQTIGYLDSGMINRHRCDTLENCAVLQAVYDVQGLDTDRRNSLTVSTLVEGWETFVQVNENELM